LAEVHFTGHAVESMEKRNIKPEEVVEALENPDVKAIDTLTGHFVVVKGNGKALVVVYDARLGGIEVVTVYRASRKAQIENRLRKGRWVRV